MFTVDITVRLCVITITVIVIKGNDNYPINHPIDDTATITIINPKPPSTKSNPFWLT